MSSVRISDRSLSGIHLTCSDDNSCVPVRCYSDKHFSTWHLQLTECYAAPKFGTHVFFWSKLLREFRCEGADPYSASTSACPLGETGKCYLVCLKWVFCRLFKKDLNLRPGSATDLLWSHNFFHLFCFRFPGRSLPAFPILSIRGWVILLYFPYLCGCLHKSH